MDLRLHPLPHLSIKNVFYGGFPGLGPHSLHQSFQDQGGDAELVSL